jgi:hypothetical protein
MDMAHLSQALTQSRIARLDIMIQQHLVLQHAALVTMQIVFCVQMELPTIAKSAPKATISIQELAQVNSLSIIYL